MKAEIFCTHGYMKEDLLRPYGNKLVYYYMKNKNSLVKVLYYLTERKSVLLSIKIEKNIKKNT